MNEISRPKSNQRNEGAQGLTVGQYDSTRSGTTQVRRDQYRDSEEVVTSFMQDGTYSPRNFATLGTLRPPFELLTFFVFSAARTSHVSD